MEARLVVISLLATALVPLAAPVASSAPACTPPWSQWVVCVDMPCVTVDGPALHVEQCVPSFCTPPWSQWVVCVKWPCVILDGPAIHRPVCLGAVTA